MPARTTNKALSKEMGAFLKTKRKIAGFSADEVAKKCGVKSKNTVYAWEAGSSGLTIDTISYLLNLYSTSFEEFFRLDVEDPYYTSDEIKLINYYRELTDDGKSLLMSTAQVFAGKHDIRIQSPNVMVGDNNAGNIQIVNGNNNNVIGGDDNSVEVDNSTGDAYITNNYS